MAEALAICGICHEEFPFGLILGHLRGAHDLPVDLATWPDGQLVIVDSTLEPCDFDG